MILFLSRTWNVSKPILIAFVIIYSVLIVCSIAFRLMRSSNAKLATELIQRTNSWWIISLGVAALVLLPSVYGTFLLGFLSFVALREMYSISPLRASDRLALFIGYLSVPMQYILVYYGLFISAMVFIPLGMFLLIPLALVISGNMERIGRSMTTIPSLLILTVYMPSHLLLLHQFEFENYTLGGGGIILFLILITAFNDVFQFTWGKLIGKRKILPNVSPNKTVGGMVGGIITTGMFGWALSFMMPFDPITVLILSITVGFLGFAGDAILSAIKRDLKIKDTGDAIPGHGGIMDRLDSFVFITPFFVHMVYQITRLL